MTKRHRIFFRIGTWALIATSAIHLVGHFAPQPQPASETERTLLQLMETYRKDFGAGFSRTTMDFLKGFSLTFSAMLLWVGLLDLLALRGFADGARLRRLAALNAVLAGVVLAITWKYFFLPPLVCVAVIFLAFLASALGGSGDRSAPAELR